jgi:hypothetical protein
MAASLAELLPVVVAAVAKMVVVADDGQIVF